MGTSTSSIVSSQYWKWTRAKLRLPNSAAWMHSFICLLFCLQVVAGYERIDFISRFNLSSSNLPRTEGYCDNGYLDSYEFSSGQSKTVKTREIFPEGFFPDEFSIFCYNQTIQESEECTSIVARVMKMNGFNLVFKLEPQPEFYYQDMKRPVVEQRNAVFGTKKDPVAFSSKEWHRVAWSVYNDRVQFYVDCDLVMDTNITRKNLKTLLNGDGDLIIGDPGKSNVGFKGSIYQLEMTNDPTHAGFMCQDFTPGCLQMAAGFSPPEIEVEVISQSHQTLWQLSHLASALP
uniref:collagen alpha-1(XI) chain-like n=1 Tax=Styela clava TaxID=7725 RepID=UPI001939F4B5|nr:collagen alpha-1(XI) chain-like [Styela clava]